METITQSLFFGIILSLIAFELALYIFKVTKFPLFNPLLLSIFFVIGFLKLTNIDFETYNKGASFINMFLGPATVILAVPLYKQLKLFKDNMVPILVGITVGSITSVVSVILIGKLLKLDNVFITSLLPKSVTTPIGIEISSTLGGIVPVTVLSIILSGIVGAILGPTICKIFKVKNEIAVGISLGTASHAIGTTKALELGQTEGAMSSLSIGIAGIITVIITPILFNLLM